MALDFEKCWTMINDFFNEEFEAGEMRKIGATRRLIDKLKIFQDQEEAQKQSTPSPNNERDVICPQCNGAGWYESEGDCGPIQVQCEYCQATGKRFHIS